jgi:phage protein U
MIEMANTATPLQLVDGAGNVYGDWVIMSIDYQEELIDQNATAKRITFKMQIKSY